MVTKIKGFTLVEILVVLTLIGVLFVAGYAGLRDFSRRQALESVKRSVQGDIKLTQQLALTGKKPNNCPSLDGYFFHMVDSSQYLVSAVCNSGDPSAPPQMDCLSNAEMCIKIVDLTTKRVGVGMSETPIMFKVVGQGTNISTSTPVIITLTNVDSGGTTTITVKSGGEIE